MEISVSQEQGTAAVSVIRVSGHLDGQTYQDLISKANEVVGTGIKNILLDLSDLTYISSAGLVSLHVIALLTRGETLPNPEHGWSTLKSMDRTRDGGMQKYLKLLNPSSDIARALKLTGFDMMLDVYDDLAMAIASF